jgi:hypothetical protein
MDSSSAEQGAKVGPTRRRIADHRGEAALGGSLEYAAEGAADAVDDAGIGVSEVIASSLQEEQRGMPRVH